MLEVYDSQLVKDNETDKQPEKNIGKKPGILFESYDQETMDYFTQGVKAGVSVEEIMREISFSIMKLQLKFANILTVHMLKEEQDKAPKIVIPGAVIPKMQKVR